MIRDHAGAENVIGAGDVHVIRVVLVGDFGHEAHAILDADHHLVIGNAGIVQGFLNHVANLCPDAGVGGDPRIVLRELAVGAAARTHAILVSTA